MGRSPVAPGINSETKTMNFYLWLKFWIAANKPLIHPNSWGALFIEQRAGRVFIP